MLADLPVRMNEHLCMPTLLYHCMTEVAAEEEGENDE